ncbi:MAG: DNA polymerase III subunit gamma/tau [Candidatus Omnitrophota bacterium]
MPYTVFALKWRPKSFDEIIGQNHIVNTLKSALEKNRLAHAYLFAGPRGVGKTSTARILAKALNCKNGPTLNPCSKCSSCLEIAEGRSFDVIEIDGASNRGIDEIRSLRESVKFAPTSGKFKIYIIDEVHMLTTEAFNALLKTLEEPPEFVKFIFATTHPHKVIPTVLSRCQRFDFRRIPVIEIIAQLEKIIKSENVYVDKEVLFAIARASDGALRDAESILDQLVSFSKEKISLKDVISVLGLVEEDLLFEITDKIIQRDARGILVLLNSVIDEGKDIAVFLHSLIEHFRNLMVAKITQADLELIDLPKDICERLFKQSKEFTLEEIFSSFNILVAAQEMSKRLESVRIPLEISLVRLVHDKKGAKPPLDTKPTAVKEKIEVLDPVNSISLEEIIEGWAKIIDALSRVKISVATYLNEGVPVRIEKNILTIGFPKNYTLHKETLEKKENKAIVENAFFELFNVNIRTNFILTQEKPRHDDTSDNPTVRSVLETFKGRVIKQD